MSVETLTALLVTKRDGRQVEFQKEKIQRAIEKAEIGLNGELSDERMIVLGRIVDDVLAEISRRFNDTIEIYEIQNIIEHLLIEDGESELAQEYISYRVDRDLRRKNQLDFHLSPLLQPVYSIHRIEDTFPSTWQIQHHNYYKRKLFLPLPYNPHEK